MNYLLHFERPYQHAQHYLGFAETDLESRIRRHRAGDGARLMAVIKAAGIGFVVARVWPDADRTHERRLKKRKASSRLCPICKGVKTYEECDGSRPE